MLELKQSLIRSLAHWADFGGRFTQTAPNRVVERTPRRLLGVVIFCLAARGWAQEAQGTPTFSVKANLVSALATVHDRDGRVVKNLTKDDFVLLEDGKPQTIRYFSQEPDLPLTVGILVDTSRSQIGILGQEGRASYEFLNQVLREDKDQAFLVSFDTEVHALQGLTSSRSELAAGLRRLTIPGDVATLIYSAIRSSSENPMREQSGRKAFILLTDGVAYKDPVSLDAAIEFAQRADTIIYPIRFTGHVQTFRPVRSAILAGVSERGKQALHRMADETGGVYYEVGKEQSIEEIYSNVEELLRNQYSIGFAPAHPDDGKYHKITLMTKDHHLIVHTRDGYYAK